MANKKITALTALATAPATTDLVPIVDVSDTTDSANGTTKKITVANFFTTPTIGSFTNATHNHENAAGGGQIDSDALSGAVSIAKGGTGQTTQTAAFDALAPTTTEGDTIYHNGSDNIRLAKGTALQTYRMNSGATAPEWASAVPFFQQAIPSPIQASTSAKASGSNSDGSLLFVVHDFTTTELIRYARDSASGAYIETHSVNMTTVIPAGDFGGIIVIGLYVYVFLNDGTNVVCRRYLAADLTDETSMTVPTVPCTTFLSVWTDGTFAYLVSAASDTTSRRWSLSGTTWSASATFAVTTSTFAESGGYASFYDGATAYLCRRAGSNIYRILKLTSIDATTFTTTDKLIRSISDNDGGTFGINIDSLRMYIGTTSYEYDEAAQISSMINLIPVTKP